MATIQGTPGNDDILAPGIGDELLGLAGNDILDAVSGQGNNTLRGGDGDDELFANISDFLFGDAGNDTLDARGGSGSNSLDGGAGSDFLFAFNNDTLIGGTGTDILFAGISGGVLTGGTGGDLFAITIEASTPPPTITDFISGFDLIGIDGFTPDIVFADLVFEQQGTDTLIKNTAGSTLAILQNFSRQLKETDFTFNLNPLPVLADNRDYYRFRNKTFSTGTYLFVDEKERDAILANPDFNQTFELESESPAFRASTQAGEDLFGFYRLRSLDVPGTYLYAGPEEYNAIFAPTSDQKDKWVKEGLDTLGTDIAEFYLYGVNTGRGLAFNRFQNNENNSFLFAGPSETTNILQNPDFSNAFTLQGGAFESFVI